jgi:hypothetical protein
MSDQSNDEGVIVHQGMKLPIFRKGDFLGGKRVRLALNTLRAVCQGMLNLKIQLSYADIQPDGSSYPYGFLELTKEGATLNLKLPQPSVAMGAGAAVGYYSLTDIRGQYTVATPVLGGSAVPIAKPPAIWIPSAGWSQVIDGNTFKYNTDGSTGFSATSYSGVDRYRRRNAQYPDGTILKQVLTPRYQLSGDSGSPTPSTIVAIGTVDTGLVTDEIIGSLPVGTAITLQEIANPVMWTDKSDQTT